MHRLGIAVVLAFVGLALLVCWFTVAGVPSADDAGSSNEKRETNASVRSGDAIVPDGEERVAIALPRDEPVESNDQAAGVRAANSLRVRVIDVPTGRPVPGAVVHTLAVVDDSLVASAELDDAFTQDVEDCVARFGLRAVCDELGEATLPRPRGEWRRFRTVYVARAGDRSGRRDLDDQRARELVVRIDRDRHVDVEVVDALGRPAVGVVVVHRVHDTAAALPTVRTWSVHTDLRGCARLPHLQTHVIAAEQSSLVGIEAPGLLVTAVPLDCLAPPTAPLRFQLPPSGAIEVVDAGPPALTEGQQFGLHQKDGRGVSARCRDGRARFPFVGLGREFTLEAITRAGARRFSITGPTRMDETVTFTVPPRSSPMLGVRVVDARGEPVVGTELAFSIEIDGTIVSTSRAVDSDGCCGVALGAANRGRTLRRLQVSLASGRLAGSVGELVVDRRIEDFVDVGELRLHDAPLWGAGRALDDADSPVGEFTLGLVVRDGDLGADAPAIRVFDDGRFELRGGEGVRSVLLLGARSLDGVAEQVGQQQAVKGATDLVVRLVRRAALTVDFVHEPGRPYRLGVALHPRDGDRAIDGSASAKVTERGTRYRFDLVPVGTYRVTATLLGEVEPILSVDDVVLRAGENRDPRLEEIVSSDVRVLRAELIVAGGGEQSGVVRGTAWIRSGGVWRGFDFLGKRIDILVRRGPVDVLVAAESFAPVRRFGVTGDFAAVLGSPPRLPVELVVDGGAPGSAASVLVQLMPQRAGNERFEWSDRQRSLEPGPAPWLEPVTVETGTSTEVPHDGPGEYRIRLVRYPPLSLKDVITDFAPATVTIPVGGVAAPLVLRVPASALAR